MKIAALQINSRHENPEDNFQLGMKYLEKAASYGSDFVILPEHWTVEMQRHDLLPKAKSIEKFLPLLQQFAKSAALNIFSPMYRVEGKKIFNSLLVINRQGEVVETYDKIYLFQPMAEDKVNVPGQAVKVVQLEGITFGLNICFDLRFSHLAAQQVKQGAQVLLYPAQWGQARLQHWLTLLTARAIEGQAYVVGCDRVGKSLFGELAGYSRIIDPWGETLEGIDQGEGIIISDINLEKVKQVRRKIPMSIQADAETD